MTQAEIFNYCDVSKQIAIGGQPANHQFGLIRDAGKEVVFQLVVKEASYSATDEAYHIHNLDLEHESMEISFAEPTKSNVEEFINIMNKHQAKQIFVHCAVGYCTSGLMVIYLMKTRQLSFEDAKQLVIQDWEPTLIWMELIQTYVD